MRTVTLLRTRWARVIALVRRVLLLQFRASIRDGVHLRGSLGLRGLGLGCRVGMVREAEVEVVENVGEVGR